MNLKGNAAPEARGAKPFQHSNIYYDTIFSQNAGSHLPKRVVVISLHAIQLLTRTHEYLVG